MKLDLAKAELIRLSEADILGYVKSALATAVSSVLTDDMELIAVGAHEQAICHRIAVSLEPMFRGLSVDCEYNRCEASPKRLMVEGEFVGIRPDIIVHERIIKECNLLVVEAKANANEESDRDLMKLKGLVQPGRFYYRCGAFLTIHNGKQELLNTMRVRASVAWYTLERQDGREVEKWVEEEIVNLPLKPELMHWVEYRMNDPGRRRAASTSRVLTVVFEVDAQHYKDGRLRMPRSVLAALGVKPGDEVELRIDGPDGKHLWSGVRSMASGSEIDVAKLDLTAGQWISVIASPRR